MYTSSPLLDGPKSYPQTRSKTSDRGSTWRGLRRKSSSRLNSVRVSSIGALASEHLPCRRIERQVGEAEHAVIVRRVAAPQQRAQAGQQLREGERLRQVVVGSRVEPLDPLAHGRPRGQEQDGRAVACRAQGPAGVEAVELGHEDVEDDRVRPSRLDGAEGVAAVFCQLDVVSLERERTAQAVPHGGLVVDHEEACTHGGTIAEDAERTLRGGQPRGSDR